MKINYSISGTIALSTGLLFAAANNVSQYTHTAFLDHIGISDAMIKQTNLHGPHLLSLLYETYASTERVLTQDESHDFQTDLYTFIMSRTINAEILQNHADGIRRNYHHTAFIPAICDAITLVDYYRDNVDMLLGKAHLLLKKNPEIADWLVEFRNAQRKDPHLCDRARLYATIRTLFISTDESWRAEQLAQFHAEPTKTKFNLSELVTRTQKINKGEDAIIGCKSFKKIITEDEQDRQYLLRKQAEFTTIRAAFDELIGTK